MIDKDKSGNIFRCWAAQSRTAEKATQQRRHLRRYQTCTKPPKQRFVSGKDCEFPRSSLRVYSQDRFNAHPSYARIYLVALLGARLKTVDRARNLVVESLIAARL
jgi:hypothetical protein